MNTQYIESNKNNNLEIKSKIKNDLYGESEGN